ncbi:glycosyltransferase [Vibrio genomosp. F10]|uniref:glycosyltransferase n=1 Tax=Vibrio genomosp. F10 TaxID=723171 RepID=UPI0002FE1033|nr:glycosyltransferase [Vibrio genomosp. F10]OEF05649.1 glycosyl transferase [Vibrio genomosp. F10 str. 9ZB36]
MHDLIVFGEDFGGLPSSTQHLIKRLAQQRKVVWINSIGLRQPKLNLNDAKRVWNKLLGRSKSGFSPRQPHSVDNVALLREKEHQDVSIPNHTMDLTIVNLKTIPAPQSRVARKIAKSLMLRQLKPILTKATLHHPVLWCSLPTAADLCGHLGESAVVYYCGDDFSSLAGVDHKTVSEHEAKLISKADMIFAASEEMVSRFPEHKTHFIPHGVDAHLFATPAPRAQDLPNRGRPIAGFYGSLSNWLDYDMLEQVVNHNQDWDFVFIGPQELSDSRLPKHSNVFYLGPKPHEQLPQYSQHWDVSLLPFKLNDQIIACSPLKLMEYLASGKPIVSTSFPALEAYKRYVNVVSNSEEMSQALHQARQQKPLPSGIVNHHSWDARSKLVDRMLELL